MSTTSLTRTTSANSLFSSPAASRASSQNSQQGTPSSNEIARKVLATATSVLPTLTLTPLKSAKDALLKQTPQTSPAPSPAPSTPGSWQHPRMDEVLRRQNATHFDAGNMRLIGYNILGGLISFALPMVLPTPWIRALGPYATYTILLLRAFLIINIALACTPLFRAADACEDVPLTPSQRQLLGLPPMSRPATPLEQASYATPPRYSRTPSSSLQGQASDSPRNSPQEFDSTLRRSSASNSPYSATPIRQSPSFLQSPSQGERRRLSYGGTSTPTRSSPLGLGLSEFDAPGSGSGTPTKSGRASVGLNSKWLYDKGRRGSGGVF